MGLFSNQFSNVVEWQESKDTLCSGNGIMMRLRKAVN